MPCIWTYKLFGTISPSGPICNRLRVWSSVLNLPWVSGSTYFSNTPHTMASDPCQPPHPTPLPTPSMCRHSMPHPGQKQAYRLLTGSYRKPPTEGHSPSNLEQERIMDIAATRREVLICILLL